MIYTYIVSSRPYNKNNPTKTYTYNTKTGELINQLTGVIIRKEKGLIASNYLSLIHDYEIVEITP
jgi:hypothetical protein